MIWQLEFLCSFANYNTQCLYDEQCLFYPTGTNSYCSDGDEFRVLSDCGRSVDDISVVLSTQL